LTRALLAIVLLALAAVLTGGWVNARSALTVQRESIHAEWPNVAGALQRRADLVAALAQTVESVAGASNPVFNDIATARAALSSGSTAQQKIQANSRLMRAFANLFLLTERYPKLTSDRNYQRIGDEIKKAESSVAIERLKYNELLEHYNAQLQRFPDNLVAKVSGFSRIDDYVITEQEIQ
jgi:LemA protein